MSAWDQFESGLAATFREVSDRVFLIIAAEADPTRYVQFAGRVDALDAEAPPVGVVPDADEKILASTGWIAPIVTQPNWSKTLVRPALTAEYAALAASCVAVLRDAYGIVSPDELSYRAWRDAEYMPVDEEWTEEQLERLDRGESVVRFATLGLSSEQ